MSSSDDPSYYGREQSQIKHFILEKYLERFAIIVGRGYDTILYVDGFSGPWNVQTEKLKDASFCIALEQLRKARVTVQKSFGKTLRLKCVFLEREKAPFIQLKNFSDAQTDVEIVALNQDFEAAIPEIVKLIGAAGKRVFPFVFIDPTGWTGFSLPVIAPLLQIQPCEVLINFMTGFIARFAQDKRESIGAGFEGLFGDDSFRDRCKGLEGKGREDALVFEYAKRIGQSGKYPYTPVTVIPQPTKDRTHFHLIYATRNLKGVEVFKEAERDALRLTAQVRADAKRRDREAKTRQSEMFKGYEVPENAYVREISERYRSLARQRVLALIAEKSRVTFDELYAAAMQFPSVQIGDLRAWISEVAEIENLSAREKVPKVGAGHWVRVRSQGAWAER